MDFQEKRIDRIESKLDDVKSEITEIKIKMDVHMAKVDEHIAGDKKIITDWKPVVALVPELKEIIENYQFEKKLKENRTKHLATVATVLGIVVALAKILEMF